MEQEEQKRKKTQRQKQKQTHNQMQNRPRAPKRSLEELTLLDRFLFDEAMENPENMETLLKLAVDDRIRLKSVPQTEKEVRRSEVYRSIRLDVWTEDVGGSVYDTEVQGKNTRNLPKRSRYYQAMIDSRMLEPGEDDFNQLPPVYIIMIMPFDLFGYGLYRYTFVEQCLEVPELRLDDGAVRIFLNTKGTKEEGVSPELVQLLQYMEHTNDESIVLEDERLRKLRENVKKIQQNGEAGVRYMQLWEELAEQRNEGREEGRKEGRKEGRREGKREGKQEGRISECMEFIQEFLEELGKVPEALQEKIRAERNLATLKDWTKKAAKAESIEAFEKMILT